MIAFPFLLRAPAEKAGMKIPATNDRDPDDSRWKNYRDEYPHFYIFLKLQLGKPMRSWNEVWVNARVIAKLTEEQIKTFTVSDFEKEGFIF